MKLVPGGDNLMKDVQCYELFGGIALKNHAFSFFFKVVFSMEDDAVCQSKWIVGVDQILTRLG